MGSPAIDVVTGCIVMAHWQGGGMDASYGDYDGDSGEWKECIL